MIKQWNLESFQWWLEMAITIIANVRFENFSNEWFYDYEQTKSEIMKCVNILQNWMNEQGTRVLS